MPMRVVGLKMKIFTNTPFRSQDSEDLIIVMEETRIMVGDFNLSFYPLFDYKKQDEAYEATKKEGLMLGANEAQTVYDHFQAKKQLKYMMQKHVGIKIEDNFADIQTPPDAQIIRFDGTLIGKNFGGCKVMALCFDTSFGWIIKSVEGFAFGKGIYSAILKPKNEASQIIERKPFTALL